MPQTSRLVLCAIACAMAWWTGAQAAPGFHMVQRIDEMLVGVDVIALDVVDRDHVAGTYFLVHARRPSPLVGYANYVVDCRAPHRIAIIDSVMPSGRLAPDQPFVQPPRRSGRVNLAGLQFEPVHTMDGTAFVAAFSCEASGAPGRAAQIAAELASRGGPTDSRSLYCSLQPDAGRSARRVEVRYSVSDNAVAVNGQWLSSGFVTGHEVVFGSGAQWRVDTRSQQARLLRDDGRELFKGDCEAPRDEAALPR